MVLIALMQAIALNRSLTVNVNSLKPWLPFDQKRLGACLLGKLPLGRAFALPSFQRRKEDKKE
jgi:hypothetical protein